MVLQHAGFDYDDETISPLRDFPNVYVDMSVLNSVGPRALHDVSFRAFVNSGFASRIVLGSDDHDYAPIIERIEGAAFLTPEQRRGIYYDNAARFLPLDSATIAADYGRRHQRISSWRCQLSTHLRTVLHHGSTPVEHLPWDHANGVRHTRASERGKGHVRGERTRSAEPEGPPTSALPPCVMKSLSQTSRHTGTPNRVETERVRQSRC